MSAPDRSWTITPTLLWFGVAVTAGIAYRDGGLAALADRLTEKRDDAAAAGPAFTGAPPEVTEADINDPDLVAKLPPPPAGSHDVGALDDVCIDGTDASCKRWAMDGFYRAFADAKADKLGRPLRVSWYGDSVIATDAIPGRLRSRIQHDLGDGGPGYVFVVAPHKFCEHQAISRDASGWDKPRAISTYAVADGLYGYGGSSIESDDDARSTVRVLHGKASRVELYYLAQPRGGMVKVTADGAPIVSASTTADAKQPGWAIGSIDGGASTFQIKADRRVRMFGVTLENDHGAVVDNLGIVSARVKSFAGADAAHWSAEIAHRSPDLVMIMIGANEAEWLKPHDQDTKNYSAHYQEILAPIRKGRPDAACLVVSPTDQAEVKDGGYASRPVMPVLVAAQREAAHAQGCAFYSTYDWMGGRGSSAKWFRKHLVSSDFQHLTTPGANKLADALYDALVAGYQQTR
jgi:lysophospholipase L1-like esterase